MELLPTSDLPHPARPLKPSAKPMALPCLAMQAACGFPSPAEDYFREEDRLDLNEKLIQHPAATFIVQADCGGSMVDFGIHDGDYLIVDRAVSPRPGHIVVALWEGGFTVKRLACKQGQWILESSAGYAPIVVPQEIALDIWGVVRWSLTHHR